MTNQICTSCGEYYQISSSYDFPICFTCKESGLEEKSAHNPGTDMEIELEDSHLVAATTKSLGGYRAGTFWKNLTEEAKEEKKKKDEEKAHKALIRKYGSEEQAWLASPLGMAISAKEAGNRFLEIELEVGISDRTVSFGMADFGEYKKSESTGLLSQIEDAGWRLEHVGYYFMITGEESRDKFIDSGQHTAVKGQTMGVYLFRNTSKQ